MRAVCFLVGIVLALNSALGQDLASIERKITKEPAYKSGAPKYALMVLGEKMTKRVWLVIDGDVLYADLNGNGDLTEEGEKIAKMDFGKFTPPDGMVSFEIKEIQDGDLVHRNFGVSMEPAERLANLATDFLKLMGKETKAHSYTVGGTYQMPELKGTGLDGRKRMVALVDEKGPLQFSTQAASAPILHFGGNLKVGLFGDHQLVVGRAREISLGIGTPGVGNGSTVWMEYNEIPLKTPIYATVTFPKGKNATESQVQKSALIDRCCGFNLLGPIATPDDVGLGSAQVEFRLDDALQPHKVEPLKTSIDVVAPKNKLTLVPVTKRIAKEYIFPKRVASPGQIHFSPDGNRLLAAEHSEGIVVVWDAKSAEQLIQFEVGENFEGQEFLHVAADWSVAYGSSIQGRKIESETLNGKEALRASYTSALRGWSLETGKQIAHMQHTPPHFSMVTLASPDGTKIACLDDLPGVFEIEQRNTAKEISIWDLSTQKATPLGERGDFPHIFSDDSKALAVNSADQKFLKWFDVATGRLIWAHAYLEGEHAAPIGLDSKGGFIIGISHSVQNGQSYDSSKFIILDTATGERKMAITIDDQRGATFSKLGIASGMPILQASLITSEKGLYYRTEIRLYSADNGEIKELVRAPFTSGDDAFSPNSLFSSLSPDGSLCAVAVNFFPKSKIDLMVKQLDPLNFPQPQVWMINLKTGMVAEKIDLPQAILQSLAFSPDGRSLAVSGLGRVLSLDISDLVAPKATK